MITELHGYLYNGKTSKREQACLVINDAGLVRCDMLLEESIHFNDINISSRVGNTARYLDFADNRRFETLNNDQVDSLCQQWKSSKTGIAHRLERNLALVAIAVIVLSIGSFATVKWGIPAASGPITTLIPTSLDKHLGKQTLALMDGNMMQESTLPVEKQQELQTLFSTLTTNDDKLNLLFRDIKDTPNAFALPDGTIVMTDKLVDISENNEQLASILLHEIAHVQERHTIQGLVRQSSLSILLILVSGDINTASTMLVLLPTWIAKAQYSQSLEWDADTYALKQMQQRNMDTNAFSNIMAILEASAPEEQNDDDNTDNQEIDKLFDYLSSHPTSDKRIARFRTKR